MTIIEKRNIILAIMIDAFRHDYIDRQISPFLYFLKNNGIYTSLVPSFGFEPDAAYFAGLFPEQCEGGMLYWYSPHTSPFKFTKHFSELFDHLPRAFELALRRAIRLYAQRTSAYPRINAHAPTMNVPLRYLHLFDFPMKYFPFDHHYANSPTIFELLSENGISWFYHGAPIRDVHSEKVVKRVESELSNNISFAFLHIGDLDPIGHKFGPNSNELINALSRVDSCVEEIWNIVRKRFNAVNLIVFGDHGMVEVKSTVDIQSKLKKLDVKAGLDYIYFLDSTFARFWFKNKKASTEISELLKTLEQGKVLDYNDFVKYRINYQHKKFGDVIFWADDGVLIFPNFFNRTSEKGMHGYSYEAKDNQSAFILFSSKGDHNKININKTMNMTEVFPILLELVGIDDAPFNELKNN